MGKKDPMHMFPLNSSLLEWCGTTGIGCYTQNKHSHNFHSWKHFLLLLTYMYVNSVYVPVQFIFASSLCRRVTLTWLRKWRRYHKLPHTWYPQEFQAMKMLNSSSHVNRPSCVNRNPLGMPLSTLLLPTMSLTWHTLKVQAEFCIFSSSTFLILRTRLHCQRAQLNLWIIYLKSLFNVICIMHAYGFF